MEFDIVSLTPSIDNVARYYGVAGCRGCSWNTVPATGWIKYESAGCAKEFDSEQTLATPDRFDIVPVWIGREDVRSPRPRHVRAAIRSGCVPVRGHVRLRDNKRSSSRRSSARTGFSFFW